MSRWVRNTKKEAEDEGKLPQLEAQFDLIARWLATHPTRPPKDDAPQEMKTAYDAYQERCIQCHTFAGEGGGDMEGPDFTGYGGLDWTRLMVMSPDHPQRYGWRNRNAMPLFQPLEGPGTESRREDVNRIKELLLKQIAEDDSQADAKKKRIEDSMQLSHLSDVDRELLLRWLVRDPRVVFGGVPISGPPRK
jgi:mono/diheme cytochrome c family protein